MKVCMYFDPYGVMDMGPEEEFEEAKSYLEERFPGRFTYQNNILPHKLIETVLDMYVFDIGGLCSQFGKDGLKKDLFRSLLNAAENKPNTLFVLWSSFTCVWYKDMVEYDFPEFKDLPNVLIRYEDRFGDESKSFETKLKEWLQ